MKDFKGHQETFFYVPDIFSELHKIYSRCHRNSNNNTYDTYDTIVLQEAINLLQQQVNYWKQETMSSNAEDFYYAFNLPTKWDSKSKEEFIWPLFIKSNLIQENDDRGRLVFFTELESTFRLIQTSKNLVGNLEIKPGEQNLICSLDFRQNKVYVTLELVLVHYPALTGTDNLCVPQLLNEAHLTISFGLKELKSSLKTYLERCCDIIPTPKMLEIMAEAIQLSTDDVKSVPKNKRLTYEKKIQSRPFYNLRCLYDKQYGLKETEIKAIQLVTVNDILEDWSDSAEQDFVRQINILLQGMGNAKARLMIILYTKQINRNWDLLFLLKSIEKWSITYPKEHMNTYRLISSKRAFSFQLKSVYKQDGLSDLVRKAMQEFNMRRDPIMVSTERPTEQSKRCLESFYFINMGK